MHDKIQAWHLQRTAFVYLRQSTPGQVKNNIEGRQRQRRMQEHVQKLGWPTAQIRLLGADTGHSGSSLHGRDDYQIIMEGVLDQTVGLVAARELSRLARDNQDWTQLVRICRYQGVLLCDEYRVYDAADPQDRVMLGIQGAFNEFELAMITERMQQSRRQKAERGELYEGFPPGYICRRPPLVEKHPDQRVQRAIEKVFLEFDRWPSVYALFKHMVATGFQLPIVIQGNDWREVQWRSPSYSQLLGMLQNPAYAGIYVRGRKKTVRELDEHGHAVQRTRRVPRDQWEFFMEDHHESFITKACWERNMAKIEANAHSKGAIHHRSPGHGSSLLAGLLRCRRCGHRLQVRYGRGASYSCRGGTLQRDAKAKRCYSFSGNHIEQQVSELVLGVVRPAAIEAAELAAQQLAADHLRQRQLIADRLAACREAEARAAREYRSTDETYTSVRNKLAAEWDEAIEALHGQQRQLDEFDAQCPLSPTAAQRKQLADLGSNLQRVWFDSQSSMILKKQIVRMLIQEIITDVDEEHDEVRFWIHWSGGHHTELRVPRRGRRRRLPAKDLQAVFEVLRKVLTDELMAGVLNREGIPSPQGSSWTKSRVSVFRRLHQIAPYSAREKSKRGWLTQAEAATRLQISPMSVSRLVQAGIIPAEQPRHGLPSVIQEQDLYLPKVQNAVHQLKTNNNRPLPADPNQLSLFT